MARGKASGPVVFATVRSRKRGDRDRRVGRTEGRSAQFRYGAFSECRHDGMTIQTGGFALVGRHAQRRISFQQLSGAKALARGKRHVLSRDIVLEIDECLRAATRSRW